MPDKPTGRAWKQAIVDVCERVCATATLATHSCTRTPSTYLPSSACSRAREVCSSSPVFDFSTVTDHTATMSSWRLELQRPRAKALCHGLRGICGLLVLASATASTLTLHPFDLSVHPTAVCNDGSPSGVYLRPSPSTKSTVWVIHQMGGDWCFDAASCALRQLWTPTLTSSKDWPTTLSVEGLMNASEPLLADANLAYVGYCTSDAYIGDVSAAGSGVVGFHFRGRAVVDATFSVLRDVYGMGSAANTSILYRCVSV